MCLMSVPLLFIFFLFSEVKRKVIDWAECMTFKVNDFKAKRDENLRKIQHEIEAGLAIVQTAQQDNVPSEQQWFLNSMRISGNFQIPDYAI